MNLGLGNRTTLKQFILPGSLAGTVSDLVPDASIDALGLGVAGLFGKHCGRDFARLENRQTTLEAARLTYVLPAYPVENVTALEYRARWSEAWSALSVADSIAQLDHAAGLGEFATVRPRFSSFRITWTGGYWFDTTEDGTGVQPDGSAQLPADLSLAWLMCCQEFWNKKDKLGLSLSSTPDTFTAIAKLELPAGIKAMLHGYRRMQLS